MLKYNSSLSLLSPNWTSLYLGVGKMRKTSVIDKKLRKKRMGLIFVILSLLAAIFFILSTRTSFFHISQIIVKDNHVVEDEKVIMASGIITGENIFKINVKKAEKNLLLHPYIKQVNVKRRLPNKILINITERQETLIIDYIGSYLYVDDEGRILNILTVKKDDKLPEVIGLKLNNPSIGEILEYKDKHINEQFQVFFDICKQHKLIESISTIVFDDNQNATIEMKSGTKVAFGTLDNVKYKLSFLSAILEDLRKKNQNCQSIYLDKGNNAIIKKDSN